MSKILLLLLKYYKKVISKSLVVLFGNSCRYYPTCSVYASDAIALHGVLKGTFLSLRRLISCNYFSKKDFLDPVPNK